MNSRLIENPWISALPQEIPQEEPQDISLKLQTVELPHPPYPVDAYHYYCIGGIPIEQVISVLVNGLVDQLVSYTFDREKCKFKCIKFIRHDRLNFNIRVYSTTQVHLVEYQRRSGSIVEWDRIYRHLCLAASTIIDYTAPCCPQSGSKKQVIFTEIDQQVYQGTNNIPSSGVESILIMLQSNFIDIRREGSINLANVTESMQDAAHLAKLGIIPMLHDLIHFNGNNHDIELDIARCAIVSLKNLCHCTSLTLGDKKNTRTNSRSS